MTCPFCITSCGAKWCPYTEEEDMKKSEVVELIWKRLGPLGISEETCAEVLNIIEKAGMLPPRAQLPKLSVSDNAWEPESED
jgi:hypothetical protein